MATSPAQAKSAESKGTVLISGGTDGLGRATALRLAGEGYRVFAGGRNAAKRETLASEARERGLPIEVLEMDVTDDASVDRAVAQVQSKGGPIEVLVNNAGIAIVSTMEEIALADLRKQYETNFFGVVRVTQRVLPEMRERRRGRIINMSSVGGKVAMPLFGPYSSTKFAIESISDAMRLELAPFGVYVVLIEPGYIRSNMDKAAEELSSAYARNAERSPYAAVFAGFRPMWEKTKAESTYTPDDCAKVISRALRDTPPKARYMVTRRAFMAIWSKRILSDRAMDNFMLKQFGLRRSGK